MSHWKIEYLSKIKGSRSVSEIIENPALNVLHRNSEKN